ncbi:Glutamate--cysteine ligase [Vibrio aerogenes CECT 7868]|uniref:Glutamate--cysteine ligase n=1 Tax=Vibrio aerogenes CECT 7868 TaxID=1216006 RepID=A0A1M5YDT2_9VIBR|nr:glutamate--cysteine ligase [Vibrio aerogenes]SHI10112.1 Glutamate--cysteine ligase [Vibrio aerogenes CECT 7868]
MTNFAKRLELIAQQPEVLKQFNRGIERETLRYTQDGYIALTAHPKDLGSALTNPLITTDFGEALLEFITPVSQELPELFSQLSDIHRFAQSNMGNERLWPMSMPCYIGNEEDIQIAQYGSSNVGRMKTLYRQGLKRRYGSLMQVISGVHFNFSFSEHFWEALFGQQSEKERSESRTSAYMGVIRNYYRFGWLIPYLFGASPAISSCFIKGRETQLPFQSVGHTLYLPYATSLRLSDLGYTNHAQSSLKIGFNSLEQYLTGLNQAIRTPSEDFSRIGVKVGGNYRQLNSNVLQIENELYAPVRPKRVANSGEKPSEALARGGIEYIEVRSLDVNPYSPVGVSETQVRFLDLFLTWAALSDSELMDGCELECWRDNWRKVILEGRKPGLELQIGCHGEVLTLQQWALRVFKELELIADLMDSQLGGNEYRSVCRELSGWVENPERTLSGQLLNLIQQSGGLGEAGRYLGEKYSQSHLEHPYTFYTEQHMIDEAVRSVLNQKQIENEDEKSFDDYLEEYFSYLKTHEISV